MHRHFEEAEQELKQNILYMGGLAEEMIRLATLSLSERNEKHTAKVFENEELVNKLHIQVDDLCLKFIALHQPAAQDLRFILASTKVSSDLERIADQAVNISESTLILLKQPQLENRPLDIPRMADIAKRMVKESLDAFVQKNVELARSVISQDNLEDELKTHALQEFMQIMQSDPATIQRALIYILIARNLERISDHATNIAEDVIFMVLGKDIRHNAEASTPSTS